MKTIGISCFFHDSSACLITEKGIVAAAAEERFSRIKHDNAFPEKAIDFCLRQAGCAINEIDAIVFYEKPIVKFERLLFQHIDSFPKSLPTFLEHMSSWINQKLNIPDLLKEKCNYYGQVLYVPHHLSHSASSYYLSGFDQATIVTLDGVGEWATATIGQGKKNQLSISEEIHFPHSLGLLYSTITAFLGFKVNSDEYKVMGMSAYGNPDKYLPHFRHLIKIEDNGSFRLNLSYFDFTWANRMPSKKMAELFSCPQRKESEPLRQIHADIAAALQLTLEKTVFNLLNAAHSRYPSDNLCLAGGVALNSLMNGKILSHTPYTNIYIPPDPGDGGGAMGAALFAMLDEQGLPGKNKAKLKKKIADDFKPFLGPSFAWYEIETVLKANKLKFTQLKRKPLLKKAAGLLAKQKVIGWFQGGMEWGPRALGARSILASASQPEMKAIINKKIKKREPFRPFAPVIPEKYVKQFFETDKPLPTSANFMVMVYPFKENKKKEVPAVVHHDGTGRLQVISRDMHPLYYDLIEEYKKTTGTPIIINTSFNVQEPIVCTPQDAINCFFNSDLDALFIGDYFVEK